MTAPGKLISYLSGPRLFNLVLPILMVYLIAGTVAQKYIGLYEATRIFFSDPILWLGFLPLPGLPILLAGIVVNLGLKLLLKSPWNKYTAGTIVIHIGVLLLLIGGLFTALFSQESYLDLYEGQEKSFVSDYHAREFVLLDDKDNAIETHAFVELKPGRKLHIAEPPIVVEILEACKNCAISMREDSTEDYHGMAAKMKISPDKLKKQDEENLSGVTFSVQGSESDGIYLALDEVPKLPEIQVGEQTLKFALRKARTDIPFSVRLLSFKRELYPGTEMAKAYESRIEITDGPSRWQTLVSMNQPVRYKGYTLFQSSFAITPAGEMSVLAVVKNSGRVFPYISGISICLGLILHLFIRAGMLAGKPRTLSLLILMGLLCVTNGAKAQENTPPLPMEKFAEFPVLHEGRMKPLDSFARAILKKLSGQDHIENLSAVDWLAEALFNPSRAENREVIKILNPELRALLNLPTKPGNQFSAQETARALAAQKDKLPEILKVPEDEKTPAQKDFITLHQNLALLNNVMSSLSLFLPLSATLPEDGPESLKPHTGKILTYLDTLKFSQTLETELKTIVEKKGKNIDAYTPTEQAIVFLSFSISGLRQKGAASDSLKVIPVDTELWQSPWTITLEGTGTPQSAQLFTLWKDLATAYQSGNQNQWTETLTKIIENTTKTISNAERKRLEAEYHYNRIAPFKIAFILFALSALALTLSAFIRLPRAVQLSAMFLALGTIVHIGGLAMRIYILQRPPVSTLYESILFVTAVTTLYSFILYMKQKNKLWLAIGVCSGIILSLLGFSHDNDSDNLMMLTAVLNTNFWLATHVLCITTGYGFSILTAFLAHWSLVVMARTKTTTPPAELYKTTYTTALVALLFCATGTILGGIWADQSWGRFWGWDPKENGALLLVLWLIWVIHGRLAGQFSSVQFTAGLAFTLAVVAVSWFGVNLLSVGLHAYGFTEAAAWLFWSVLIAETLICTTAIIGLRPKHKVNTA